VIFVVSDAGIVEQGTHDTLMATNGIYADLYRRQSHEAADGTEVKKAMSIPLTARAS
jgi:ABC-type transport system involved in cytochrome bd biosynthesis fused ATPase/permease subunit